LAAALALAGVLALALVLLGRRAGALALALVLAVAALALAVVQALAGVLVTGGRRGLLLVSIALAAHRRAHEERRHSRSRQLSVLVHSHDDYFLPEKSVAHYVG